MSLHLFRYGLRKERWHRIADLDRYPNLGSIPAVVVRKGLQASRLPVGDWPVLGWMEIASLLGLVELAADGAPCRLVPLQPAKQVCSPLRLPYPAGGSQLRGTTLQIEAVPALGNEPIPSQRCLGGVASYMKFRCTHDAIAPPPEAHDTLDVPESLERHPEQSVSCHQRAGATEPRHVLNR